jgi:hypothetical protein
MSGRAKFIAALGASCITGMILAALILTVEFRAASDNSLGAARQVTGAIAMFGVASDAPEPTFYSEMTKVNAGMHEGMQIVPSGGIDHDFMRMMIPHHQGAIDMALVLLKYGRDEKLKRLAQSIIVEQGQEIAYMRSLLATQPGQISNTNRIVDEQHQSHRW